MHDTTALLSIKKSEVFHVHNMKAYRGEKVQLHSFLTSALDGANFTSQPLYPRERTPVPTEEESRWAPVPVWTFWRREKFIALTRIRTHRA
jgi:hypothetical protein